MVGTPGAGVLLQYKNDVDVYVTLTGVTKVSLSGPSFGTIDLSHMQSPAAPNSGFWKEIDWDRWVDPGQLTVELNFSKAVYTVLAGFTGLLKVWRITFIEGTKFDFTAKLAALPFDAEKNASTGITQSITLDLSGPIVYTAGA